MKILVADKCPEAGLNQLRDLGCEVLYEPDAKDQKLVDLLVSTRAEVLVVRSTKVTRPMLADGQVALVVRAGAGYNTIDVKAASELGVYVANCPGKNSVAVAELAFGLILALDRRIPDNVNSLREGRWNKGEFGKGCRGLLGRTLGLIGLGNIGREMISRAKAFGMTVAAWSRSLTPEKAAELGVDFMSSPEQVAAHCDILSVHLALEAGTRGRINSTVFAEMRKGALFINTSRAEVVDSEALQTAMKEKGIRAGLDVYPDEPTGSSGTFEHALAKNTSVYGTHHIGASTDQSEEAVSMETAWIIQNFKESGHVPNCVNRSTKTPAKFLLVVRHLDRVGVLAHVFKFLKEAGINVQEMENIVFEGAHAAIARIRLDQDLDESRLDALKKENNDILQLNLLPL